LRPALARACDVLRTEPPPWRVRAGGNEAAPHVETRARARRREHVLQCARMLVVALRLTRDFGEASRVREPLPSYIEAGDLRVIDADYSLESYRHVFGDARE